MSRRAVFLDRDGVINRATVREGKPYPPKDVSELVILPGVAEALKKLKQAGYLLIVVTNQPDVARGTVARETVEAINHALMETLVLDEILTCFHDSVDKCDCRKPAPGMLLSAAVQHNIALAESFMVGDRWRDIEAGERAGCKTIFIDYSYDEKQPAHYDHHVHSLAEAAEFILAAG